jgi:hypothetical protein
MDIQLLAKALKGSISVEETEILRAFNIGIDGYILYDIKVGLPEHIKFVKSLQKETPELIGTKEVLESSLIKFFMSRPSAHIGSIEWIMQFPAVNIYNKEYLDEFKSHISSHAPIALEDIPPTAIYYCYFQLIEKTKKNNNLLAFHLLKYYILLWIAAIQENKQKAEEIYLLYRELSRDYLHCTRFMTRI